MLRRRTAVCCLALLLALGNAAVVQAIGWAGMIASRSLDAGFGAAVASTFSGASPCCLCRAAAAMDDRGPGDRAAQVLQSVQKIDAPPADRLPPISAAPPGTRLAMPDACARPAGAEHAPEPPPPRC